MNRYLNNAEAELLWLRSQIVMGPAPISLDVSTPFGYSVVALRDRAEVESCMPYLKNLMDERVAKEKIGV